MKSKLLLSFELLLVLLLVVALFGCGGKGKQSSITTAGLNRQPVADQTFEGITHDGFELVPSGPNGKPDASQKGVLAFSVTPESGTTVVTISAVNATNLKWALLTLKYDPGKMTPTKVDFGGFLSGDVLKFSLLSRPGIVPVGICKVNYDKAAGVSGSGTLATVTFTNAPFSGKSVSSAPRLGESGKDWENRNHVTDLSQPTQAQPGITWSEKLDADGNLSGEVGIDDLAPLALDYGLTTAANPQVTNVDYDANGEVGITDLQPLAYFYSDTITGYDLYYALVPAGDPAPVHSAMTRLTSTMPDIPRPGTTPPGALGWYEYHYDVPASDGGGNPVWDPADLTKDLYVQVVPTGYQTGVVPPAQEESDPATIGSSIVQVKKTTTGAPSHLITKIYIQVNGADPTPPLPTKVEANSKPTFTLYQVDDYDSTDGTTTTRAAAPSEAAAVTWTTDNAAAVPMSTPNTGNQVCPGTTPDWPVTATITADFYGSSSQNPPGPIPPGQTHITTTVDVGVTYDPNAGVIYDVSPVTEPIYPPQAVTMFVKNFNMTTAPPGEVTTMKQQLVLESYPSGSPKFVFQLSATVPPPQMTFSYKELPAPPPAFPNATHQLTATMPYLQILPGQYRWRLNNNLGDSTAATYTHPSTINAPPFDDTDPLNPIVTPPGTIFTIAGLETITSVTWPWHDVANDVPELWIYPSDPIIRKDGNTNDQGVPDDPAWFGIFIKGQNVNGVQTNGQEWTITPDIPAQPGPPPVPGVPASPTAYWNPGNLPMTLSKKSPWALVTPLPGNILPGAPPAGTTYDYHIIGFGGATEISTGSINYLDLPGPGGGWPELRDFGYNPWGSDGLSPAPDWSVKTVQLQFQPTIVLKGRDFVPSTLLAEDPVVALCEDPFGMTIDYYVPARVVLPSNPNDPATVAYITCTLKTDYNILPAAYYLQVQNRLNLYQANSTIPNAQLVCQP